ncbi:MAG: helix-turn-helix transcriptional regulator [bacterium]|nr:helix-turn-helix transcriptional regulator [bacterium]
MRSPARPIAPADPTNGAPTAQQAIGSFLRATREAQQLTQEQVADLTKDSPWQISRAAVSAIERGQNFPGLEAMLALSNVLYIDPKELVERARVAAVTPEGSEDLSSAELEKKASDRFWEGDYRSALGIYNAIIDRVSHEFEDDPKKMSVSLAPLEIRRATCLKRAGALQVAIGTAERAIALSIDAPKIQAEAYVVLADLQCLRGHLPLAGDAARRARELSVDSDPRLSGWAWMVQAQVHYLSDRFAEAREAFQEAHDRARLAGDELHLTHIEGDIGMCWLAEGRLDQAREWFQRATKHAKVRRQPVLEASWLVELGRLDLEQGNLAEAEARAVEALNLAVPRGHNLTQFRAEWLRHNVVLRTEPGRRDRVRLALLRKLYLKLDQHEGIAEIREFKQSVLRGDADA